MTPAVRQQQARAIGLCHDLDALITMIPDPAVIRFDLTTAEIEIQLLHLDVAGGEAVAARLGIEPGSRRSRFSGAHIVYSWRADLSSGHRLLLTLKLIGARPQPLHTF